MFSERRPPKSENREAIPNHRDEKSRAGYDKRQARIRRTSLPAYVSGHRRSAISPQSPTEKVKNKGFLADADVNKKELLQVSDINKLIATLVMSNYVYIITVRIHFAIRILQ
jgi:primosomal replication protein N